MPAPQRQAPTTTTTECPTFTPAHVNDTTTTTECPNGTTTTTTEPGGSTTTTTTEPGGSTTTTTEPGGSTTTTTEPGGSTTTTTFPTGGFFSIQAAAVCDDGDALINITMGNRPDLNGQVGLLTNSFNDDEIELTFISNATQQIFYPEGTTEPVTLTYTLGDESR